MGARRTVKNYMYVGTNSYKVTIIWFRIDEREVLCIRDDACKSVCGKKIFCYHSEFLGDSWWKVVEVP